MCALCFLFGGCAVLVKCLSVIPKTNSISYFVYRVDLEIWYLYLTIPHFGFVSSFRSTVFIFEGLGHCNDWRDRIEENKLLPNPVMSCTSPPECQKENLSVFHFTRILRASNCWHHQILAKWNWLTLITAHRHIMPAHIIEHEYRARWERIPN